MRYWSLLLTILLGFTACMEDGEGRSSLSTVPSSSGKIDEVVVVMDESKWAGDLGLALRVAVQEEYGLLPQPEPSFDLRQIQPSGLNTILKRASSILIVGDTSNIGPTSLYMKQQMQRFNDKIPASTFTIQDPWATPQQVTFLYAKTEAELIELIKVQKDFIKKRLYKIESKKALNNAYAARVNEDVTQQVKEQLKIDLKIPNSFRTVELNDTMLWIRQDLEGEVSVLMVYTTPYKDKAQFSTEYAVACRNMMNLQFTTETEGSHAITDTITGYLSKQMTVGGKEVIETRGLWRMTKNFLGGPFINYLMIDEENQQIVVFDGMVFAPNFKKRKPVRRLEVLLQNAIGEEF